MRSRAIAVLPEASASHATAWHRQCPGMAIRPRRNFVRKMKGVRATPLLMNPQIHKKSEILSSLGLIEARNCGGMMERICHIARLRCCGPERGQENENSSCVVCNRVFCGASRLRRVLSVGGPAGPARTLDFDNPPVPLGPIAGNDPVFTNVGIRSVSLMGTWVAGDTISAGFNGNVLVSNNNSLEVGAPGGPMDNLQADAGMRFDFTQPVISFGFVFVDQVNHTVDVELFSGAQSLGVGSFVIAGSFPNPPTGWVEASGRLFDAIEVRNGQGGAQGGWGPDDIWVEVPAPGALAVLGLGGLVALRPSPVGVEVFIQTRSRVPRGFFCALDTSHMMSVQSQPKTPASYLIPIQAQPLSGQRRPRVASIMALNRRSHIIR